MTPYIDINQQKKYQRDWYQKNKERLHLKQQKKRDKKRKYVNDYKKEQACNECGKNDIRCLDFHHLDRKSRTISEIVRKTYSLVYLIEEMKKCIVLCSNCHRILHYEERKENINKKNIEIRDCKLITDWF